MPPPADAAGPAAGSLPPPDGRVAIGVGCVRGSSAAAIARAVDQALGIAGVAAAQVAALASVSLKADEAGLLAFARARGLPLSFHTPEQLDQVEVPNPSPAVRRHVGCASIAEAAALLAAGAGRSALLLEKHRVRDADGSQVTVSIARIPQH